MFVEETSGQPAKEHPCYLNWNLSSREMEPDFMAEAFEMGLSLTLWYVLKKSLGTEIAVLWTP